MNPTEGRRHTGNRGLNVELAASPTNPSNPIGSACTPPGNLPGVVIPCSSHTGFDLRSASVTGGSSIVTGTDDEVTIYYLQPLNYRSLLAGLDDVDIFEGLRPLQARRSEGDLIDAAA